MDILELIKTIKDDWAVLVFFFSLGAAWWQGKSWFSKVNDTLDTVADRANQTHAQLHDLQQKMDHLHDRVGNLEKMTDRIDRELQDQEVKLAVLETAVPNRRATNR